MKNFDTKLNQLAHNKRIKNAKSSYNKDFTKEISESPSTYKKSKDTNIIENLLKSFGISQYFRKLCQYGYDTNLVRLKNLTQTERETLYDTIKVFPGLKSRFNTMLDMLKCIVIEDGEDTDMNSSKEFVDKKRPRTHQEKHSSRGNYVNKDGKEGLVAVGHARDLSNGPRQKSASNLRNSNVLRSINMPNVNRSLNFYKNAKSNYDLRSEMSNNTNKENLNSTADTSDSSYIISMLENSNKNLNIETYKLRKELDFFKKATKMYEQKFNLPTLRYTEENTLYVEDYSKFNEFIDGTNKMFSKSRMNKRPTSANRRIYQSNTTNSLNRVLNKKINKSKDINLDKLNQIKIINDNSTEVFAHQSKLTNEQLLNKCESLENLANSKEESKATLQIDPKLNSVTKDSFSDISLKFEQNRRFNNLITPIDDRTYLNQEIIQDDIIHEVSPMKDECTLEELDSHIQTLHKSPTHFYGQSYDNTDLRTFEKSDFLTIYKGLANSIYTKVAKNNKNFRKLYTLCAPDEEGENTPVKPAQKYMHKNKYSKDQYYLFTNKYTAWVDEMIIDNPEVHMKINSEEVSLEEIYYFCLTTHVNCKLEKEIPIITHAYLELIEEKSGVKLMSSTWKRVVLISIVLASKMWDDESFENQHFAKTLEVEAEEINTLERLFLTAMDYKMYLSAEEYSSSVVRLKNSYQQLENGEALNELDRDLVFRFGYKSDQVDFDRLISKVVGDKKKLSSKLGRNLSLSV